MGSRVDDERDEEQPCVDPPEPIGTIGVVVTPPQHLDALIRAGVHHPDVRVMGNQRLGAATLELEVRRRLFLAT